MNLPRFSIPVVAVACFLSALASGLVAMTVDGGQAGELPAACEDLVMASDQMLIGAGQVVADAGKPPASGAGVTRLQREAQLQTVADRYERARDACLEASE